MNAKSVQDRIREIMGDLTDIAEGFDGRSCVHIADRLCRAVEELDYAVDYINDAEEDDYRRSG